VTRVVHLLAAPHHHHQQQQKQQQLGCAAAALPIRWSASQSVNLRRRSPPTWRRPVCRPSVRPWRALRYVNVTSNAVIRGRLRTTASRRRGSFLAQIWHVRLYKSLISHWLNYGDADAARHSQSVHAYACSETTYRGVLTAIRRHGSIIVVTPLHWLTVFIFTALLSFYIIPNHTYVWEYINNSVSFFLIVSSNNFIRRIQVFNFKFKKSCWCPFPFYWLTDKQGVPIKSDP